MPRPPARETSATSSGPATPPMPDWRMGYSMLRRSQSAVRSVFMSTPSSEPERASIGSRIRAAEEAAVGIEPDALGVAEQIVPLARDLDVVSARGELGRHLGAIASLEAESAGRRSPRATIDPARRLHARLRAHAAIETARDERRLRLRLAFAAHGPVDEARAAVLEIHGRDQRVQGALAGSKGIGLAGIQREERAAILKDHAGVPGHEARAPREVHRLDERDRVALSIGGDDGDGVAARGHPRRGATGPTHVD